MADAEQAPKPDWRIGLSCKSKYRSSQHYYDGGGKILSVWPSGTGGIHDKDGVLKIELAGGSVILAAADQWVTA